MPDHPLLTWAVDVEVTDRTREDGGFRTTRRRIFLLAATPQEATLAGAQWAAATIPDDDMVVAARAELWAA